MGRATIINDDDKVDDNAIQYVIDGEGRYVPSTKSVSTTPPGFYDVVDCGWGRWGLAPKSPVSDQLIDIPGTVADEIFTDIDAFLARGPVYRLYELTHKRGYMLHGPPGSGKTSIALMLARRFVEKSGGVVMYIDSGMALVQGVSIMQRVEPGRPSMYLIEEADTIVDDTTCLSILDGELSIRGAVFVAMTNYRSSMPPRITNRPGRFDRVVFVGCPPEPVQLEYLRRVALRGGPKADKTAPRRIVEGLRNLSISMAHLREAFIVHVLMGVPMEEVRRRFEEMGRPPVDLSAEEPVKPVSRARAIAEDEWVESVEC